MIKFGIYTSFYNCIDFVDRTFRNIEALNYDNFEWHILDDGSSDGTDEEIKRRLEESPRRDKIFIVNQESKKEMYWFPNRFFDPTFDWIVLVDSDDELDPDSLKVYNDVIGNNEDIGLVSSDFHRIRHGGGGLESISYILNDEMVSKKMDRYHPLVNYRDNLSYFCYGCLRAFRNYPDLDFKITDVGAGAEDSYHVMWANSHGKYLHIPRAGYKWYVRTDSESHKVTTWDNFNANFEISYEKLKASDFGVDMRFNHIYKETCALGSYPVGGLSNRMVTLYTRPLHEGDQEMIKMLYPSSRLTINGSSGELNIIVANHFDSKSLNMLLKTLVNTEILLYYQDDKEYETNDEKDRGNKEELHRIWGIATKYLLDANFFHYIRHIIVKGKVWNESSGS